MAHQVLLVACRHLHRRYVYLLNLALRILQILKDNTVEQNLHILRDGQRGIVPASTHQHLLVDTQLAYLRLGLKGLTHLGHQLLRNITYFVHHNNLINSFVLR